MKTDALSIGTAVGMTIVAIIFFVITFINEDKLDTYLLGAFIAAQIMLFLFGQWFQNRRSSRNEKKDHTQHICEVYKLLTIVGIRQGRFQRPWEYFLMFSQEYTSFADKPLEELLDNKKLAEPAYEDQLKYYPAYDHYETALKHLGNRKYKHIYRHWEKTKNLLDELNAKTSIEERLQDVINEKVNHYFPTLPSVTSGTELPDYYNVDRIVQFMMRYFGNQDFANHALDSLDYDGSDGTTFKPVYSHWWPNDFHIIIRSDYDLDFETYKKLVKEMLDDTSLKDFYNEFADEYRNITKELADFRDELEKLVNNLKIGVPLEGKCKGCPS